MGEAKRRGNYEERVSKAKERTQNKANAQVEAQIRMQEHLNQLQARRAQMEKQMGPMDKLYVDQHQMLQQAAAKLKQMEGVQSVTEQDGVMMVSLGSPVNLGAVIEGDILGHEETTIVTPNDDAVILKTHSEALDAALQGGIPANELFIVSSQSDSSHFDDLAPIIAAVPATES